jgi:hypothetical protein
LNDHGLRSQVAQLQAEVKGRLAQLAQQEEAALQRQLPIESSRQLLLWWGFF